MSGFFGMLRRDGKPIHEKVLRSVAEGLRFRGPDGANVWSGDGLGGCFALMRTGPAAQAEQQPVMLGGRFLLWGDIRIDARDELRKRLADEGCEIAPDASSEEYFLHAWAKWGAGALEQVIGDFSVALWDAAEKTLWCVRDFVGARPFYYANVGNVFCFGNALQSLRQVPEISNELDEEFVSDFLLEGWSNEPSRTVYRGIRRLPAGHVLQFSNGQTSVRRFRKLPIKEPLRLKRPEEYVENYLELVRTAIKDRFRDRPTSLYLSGGMDSSAVCALTAEIASQNGRAELLKAFTISWKPFFPDEEPDFARLTAAHLGIAHEVFEETQLVPFEAGEAGGCATPEPTLDVFFARDRRYYRQIAKHANVVLSGDGGDNVLVGQAWPYLRYLRTRGEWGRLAREFGGYVWSHGKIPPLRGGFRARLKWLLPGKQPQEAYPEWFNEDFETRAKVRERWAALRDQPEAAEHPVHPQAYEGLHSGYWAAVLETEDAGWTKVTLETRAPLLDERLLRFLLRLPQLPWCMDKELSRVAMNGFLPDALVRRPKTPLGKDPAELLHGEDWRGCGCVPRDVPKEFGRFVKWEKWCETLLSSKGSLSWPELRPLILLKWLESR